METRRLAKYCAVVVGTFYTPPLKSVSGRSVYWAGTPGGGGSAMFPDLRVWPAFYDVSLRFQRHASYMLGCV